MSNRSRRVFDLALRKVQQQASDEKALVVDYETGRLKLASTQTGLVEPRKKTLPVGESKLHETRRGETEGEEEPLRVISN